MQTSGGTVGGFNGSGSVSLSGIGSVWNSSGSIYVGNDPATGYVGTGTISVNTGAALSTAGTLKIWNASGNVVNLAGGTIQVGQLDTSGMAGNFNWTSGGLIITNGGLAVAPTGPLGSSVTIGTGRLLSVSGNIQLGSGSSLTQSGSGAIMAGSLTQTGGSFGAASLLIGAGGIGSYALSGGNAVIGGNLQVSGGTLAQSATGALAAGSILLTGGTITQNTAGSLIAASLNQAGGTLIVPSLVPGSGGIGAYNWSGGTLEITAANVEIGSNGLFGSMLTLPSGKTLIAGVGVTVDPGSTLNLQGGGLTIPTGATLNNTGAFNQSSGTLTVNGAVVNSGTAAFGGTQNWGPGSVFVNLAGTATFNSNLNASGFGPVVVVTGGTVNFNSSQQLARLTISSSAVIAPPPDQAGVYVLSTASLSVIGTLDLTGNDLDVQGGTLSAISALVAQGYNGGNWNGSGITSSTAAHNSLHLTALGTIQNNQGGLPLYTAADPFDGTIPAAGDILVKYTYYGDTNLDGKVDGSDYSRIDAAYLADRAHPGIYTGWFNGDFNSDGVVDGSDYTLIDNAFNLQGAQLTDAIVDPAATFTTQIAAGSSVPEPTAAILISAAAAMLLGRQRQRRKWRSHQHRNLSDYSRCGPDVRRRIGCGSRLRREFIGEAQPETDGDEGQGDDQDL